MSSERQSQPVPAESRRRRVVHPFRMAFLRRKPGRLWIAMIRPQTASAASLNLMNFYTRSRCPDRRHPSDGDPSLVKRGQLRNDLAAAGLAINTELFIQWRWLCGCKLSASALDRLLLHFLFRLVLLSNCTLGGVALLHAPVFTAGDVFPTLRGLTTQLPSPGNLNPIHLATSPVLPIYCSMSSLFLCVKKAPISFKRRQHCGELAFKVVPAIRAYVISEPLGH